MNHLFIKMLRFEWKSNYMMWLFNLIIGVGLITTIYFKGNTHNSSLQLFIYPVVIYPLFLMLTWVFTINSYQESTKNQSMQMYHLIPIGRNTKFFSKQFITLIAYPLTLVIMTSIFIGIIRIFVNAPNVLSNSSMISHESYISKMTGQYFFAFWILGHSVSTFFAIIFKKNKVLYSLLIYFVLKFVLAILMMFFMFVFKSLDFQNTFLHSQNNHLEIIGVIGMIALTALFYGLSYRLFFRRQL